MEEFAVWLKKHYESCANPIAFLYEKYVKSLCSHSYHFRGAINNNLKVKKLIPLKVSKHFLETDNVTDKIFFEYLTKAYHEFLSGVDNFDDMEQGLAATRQTGDLIRETALRWHLGRAYFYAGRIAQSRSCVQEAVALSQALDDSVAQVYQRRLLVLALEALGHPEPLREAIEALIQLGGELGFEDSLSHMLTRLASLELGMHVRGSC